MINEKFINQSLKIRNEIGAKLLRKISLKRMHYALIGLFCDRTTIDTSLMRFNIDIKERHKYNDCLQLNDDTLFKYNKDSDSVDESNNMFVPFGDVE